MMDWAEKYRPETLQDIVGNASAIRQMAEWARTWSYASKPLVLYGKPGIGKTSAAYALAHDMKWEVVELNASDQRTGAVIEKIAGSSSTTASLTGASRKLIILDEADNIHGTADRGGGRAIQNLIQHSKQPIILIVNDLFGIPREIKSRCETVQFKALQARSIVPRLRYICSREAVTCSEQGLSIIAENSAGDMRAAVNMLYAAAVGQPHLDAEGIHTSQKDERATIFELIRALFGKGGDEDLLRMAYDVSETPDTVEQWIGENLINIENSSQQNEAYRNLARADEFIGSTYRRQYYTLWRYATALMLIGTAGPAAGRGLKERIMPPSHWKKLGALKRQKAVRTNLLNKLSQQIHIPQNILREEFLTPLSLLVERDPHRFVEEFELDRDELNFFLHDRDRSARIMEEIRKGEKPPGKETSQVQEKREEEEEEPRSSSTGSNQATLFDKFS